MPAPAAAPSPPAAAAAAASHAAPTAIAIPARQPQPPVEAKDYSLPPSREEAEAALRAALAAELAEARQREERADPFAWLDVRVFVSSTFKDMHGERDCLNKVVFPRLNQEVGRARRTRFTCVDLRWGLTVEETSAYGRGAVLCCLDEIRRCRPWFLCLLGARYGWVPERTYLPGFMSDDDLERYAWLRKWPLGDSVTELEVWAGLLGAPVGGGPAPRAFAFLRDPSFASKIVDEAGKAAATYRCGYAPGGAHGPPAASGLEDFGAAVFEALRAAAEAARPVRPSFVSCWRSLRLMITALQLGSGNAGGDPFSGEREAQRLLVERLAGRCVGREALAAAIADFACGRPAKGDLIKPPPAPAKPAAAAAGAKKKGGAAAPPAPATSNVLVVTGRPGSGKTSVMAQAALRAAAERKNVVVHFVAGTEHPSGWRSIERRLRAEVKAAGAQDLQRKQDEIEDPPIAKLAATVPGGIAVIIDAVNQIKGGGYESALGVFKGDCRLVLSTVEGSGEKLARAFGAHRLPVPGLDATLAGEIVRRSLADGGKRLTEGQAAALLKKQDATAPLYLRLAVDELLVFGLFEGLDAKIGRLPGDTQGLLASVLERLEADSDLAAPALALIAVAPDGISEADLLLAVSVAEPALGPDPGGEPRPVPRLRWSLLANGIAHLLRPASGSAGLLSFSHRQVARAVRARYLAGCAHGPDCEATAAGDVCAQCRPDPDPGQAKNLPKFEAEWAAKDGRLHQALALTALISPSYRACARHHIHRSAPWHKPAATAPYLNAGVARLASLTAFAFPCGASGEGRREGLLRGVCAALAAAPALRKLNFGMRAEVSGRGDLNVGARMSHSKVLSKEAAGSVGLLLRRAPRLEALILDDLGIDAARLAPILEGARAGGGRLRGLSLAGNRLYSDAAAPLAEALATALPALERLDLSANRPTAKGMDTLAPALAAAPALRALYVDFECFGAGYDGSEEDQGKLVRPLARFAAAAAGAAPELRLYFVGASHVFKRPGWRVRTMEDVMFGKCCTMAGAAHLVASGGAVLPCLASLDALNAGSMETQVLWLEDRPKGLEEYGSSFGRLYEPVDPEGALEPSFGCEGEPLLGVWAGPAGLELRLQEAVGLSHLGRLLFGSLRDPNSGLWVLKSAPGVPPAAATVPLPACCLVGANGSKPDDAGQARASLLEGGTELDLTWGPAGAPEASLARARLHRVLPRP
eukprot:tig00000057_g87.t1